MSLSCKRVGFALGVLVLLGLGASPAAAQQPTPEGDLTVLSPRQLQVVQRTSPDAAWVLVSGRVKADADKVEVRFSGKAADGKDLPGEWQSANYNTASRAFLRRVRVPAGGWYRAEVRATKGGQPAGQPVAIEKVGVGEVFLIAGQSNSTNSGEQRITQSSGMVSSFSGSAWQVADDPQPGVHDNSGGGSPWPAFGDAMYAKYKLPIGIASTGHGGTSTNAWQPGGELFNWMMTRVRQLGPGGFRAVLWHQGESDVGMTVDEYAQKLTNVIRGSTDEAGWQFPWFVAQVSYHNPDKPSHDTTRSAQKRLWEQGVALEGPDTDTLGGDNRDGGGKGIHFSPKGLKAHGEMWAEKVGAFLDTALAQERSGN